MQLNFNINQTPFIMKKIYLFSQIICVLFFTCCFTISNIYAQCDPIPVTNDNPYTDSFEALGLGCWTTEVVSGNDDWTDTYAVSHTGGKSVNYSSSIFGDFLNVDDDDPLSALMILMEMMENLENLQNGSARIISPILDLSGVNGQVSLSFFRKQNTAMTPQLLYVFYRSSPTSQWALLQQYTGATDWVEETLVLPAPTATYQISFLGVFDVENMGDIDITSFLDENAEMNFSSEIYLDDVRVGTSVACDAPTALTISNITAESATATWAGTAESWTLEYGPAGFNQGSGTTVTAQNSIYTITGLNANTAYDVYVRANCSNNVTSGWSQSNFTTTSGNGINENSTSYLSISPNPTTGLVRCTLNSHSANTRMQVLDIYGKLLIEQTIDGSTATLDLSDKASGIYFLRVISDNQVVTTKKIIRR